MLRLLFAFSLVATAFAGPPSHSNSGGLPACETERDTLAAEVADLQAQRDALEEELADLQAKFSLGGELLDEVFDVENIVGQTDVEVLLVVTGELVDEVVDVMELSDRGTVDPTDCETCECTLGRGSVDSDCLTCTALCGGRGTLDPPDCDTCLADYNGRGVINEECQSCICTSRASLDVDPSDDGLDPLCGGRGTVDSVDSVDSVGTGTGTGTGICLRDDAYCNDLGTLDDSP